jgi:hypothetical protein
MAEEKPQNFANHARYVPWFHFVLSGILLVNLIFSVVWVIGHPSVGAVIAVLMAFGFAIMFFCMRQFALTVQDRVIRLEMRLRLERLLPAESKPRIGELTVDQLVALRFASDAELPGLARKVLDERITDRTAIKKLVRDWQPDHLRA